MKLNKFKCASLSFICFFAISAVLVLNYHSVDNSWTEEDKQYMPKYLNNIEPLPKSPTFSQELDFIVSVQHSVLNIAPENKGLPHGQKRSLKELYEAGGGYVMIEAG